MSPPHIQNINHVLHGPLSYTIPTFTPKSKTQGSRSKNLQIVKNLDSKHKAQQEWLE